MSFDSCSRRIASCVLFACTAMIAATGLAQNAPTGWNDVRVITVKPDRIAEFEDLLAELNGAMVEAGRPGMGVFQVVHGEQNTYHIQAQLGSLSEFDNPPAPPMAPAEGVALFSRLVSTVQSQRRSLVRIDPTNWLVPGEGQQADLSGLWVLRRETVLPGRNSDYLEWFRDDLIPALRDAGVPLLINNRIVYGDNGRTWVSARPVGNWAALDGPGLLRESMGAEAAERLIRRGDAMIEHTEAMIMRQRGDLMPGQ